MISERPYFIRAMYDWLVDSGYTPQLQVDANYPGTSVPVEHVYDGVIILNVHSKAVTELSIGNDEIHFKARFSGVMNKVSFSPEAVLSVFSKETGEGMPFVVSYPEEETNKTDKKSKKDVNERSHLTLVK